MNVFEMHEDRGYQVEKQTPPTKSQQGAFGLEYIS